MTKTSKLAFSVLAAGAVALSLVPGAQAAPITGTVRMDGAVTLDSQALSTATSASFNNLAIQPIGLGAGKVDSGTGSYSTVPVGTGVSFHNFTFIPATVPVNSLWSFNVGLTAYSFDLGSITSVTHVDDTFLLIQGTGTLKISGSDNTSGNWAFSVTDTSGGHSGSFNFGFSQSDTSAAPETGTTAILLGLGLTALVVFAKLRKQDSLA